MPVQSTTILLANDDYANSTHQPQPQANTNHQCIEAEVMEPDTEHEHKEAEPVLKLAKTLWVPDDGEAQARWFEDSFVMKEPLGEPGTFGMAFRCHKKGESEMFAVKRINKVLCI